MNSTIVVAIVKQMCLGTNVIFLKNEDNRPSLSFIKKKGLRPKKDLHYRILVRKITGVCCGGNFIL